MFNTKSPAKGFCFTGCMDGCAESAFYWIVRV